MKRLILPLLLAGFLSAPALAQLKGWDPSSSYTTKPARDARESGAKSLSDIKSDLKSRYGGKMLDARLANNDTYQIIWETGRGERKQLEVDARTGRVIHELKAN